MKTNNSSNSSLRCKKVLKQWRGNLRLTNYEKKKFEFELTLLDKQLYNLISNKFQIAVFGKVGVGKSSLLNALINKDIFNTDIGHGCTKEEKKYKWDGEFERLHSVEFIDTPGIDEVNAKDKSFLSANIALRSDLILFVIDSDLTKIEQESLIMLLKQKKPILLILNRCDQWNTKEINTLIKSIRSRPPLNSKQLEILLVASSPRQARVNVNGKVRSTPHPPQVQSLRTALKILLNKRGELMLAINSLSQADKFYKSLKEERLRKNKRVAQGLIGKFAAIKASGVAANPLILVDLATSFACDTALIIQLSKVYGIEMGGTSARQLIKKLSINNASIGGAQLGIQLTLSTLQKILIAASPFTGGLSLAPAAPVAIAQAALAVHTTKITGRLAAQKFLKGCDKKNSKPTLMLRSLTGKDPGFNILLNEWDITASHSTQEFNTLLLP